MKKILCCLICCCLLFLAACGDKLYYPYEDMKEQVVKTEIVFIDFDDSKETVRELTDDELDCFLSILSEIKFKARIGDPSASVGYAFAIFYKDGYSEFLSRNGSSIYNDKGNMTGGRNIYCSEETFNELLSKFIEIE